MADEILETVTEVTEPTVEEQIAEQMNFRLSGEVPTEEIPVVEKVVTEQAADEIVDANEFLEKELGFKSWDEAKAGIAEYRQLKSNPTPAEIKYENEESEKLAKAWMSGKTDDVYEYLDQQRKLNRLTASEVTKDTADEIIKLGMQIRYKDEGLTADEINYKFSKQYGIPKEPKQLDTEDETEFELRHSTWKEQVADIEMNKIIDAKVAKRELESAKTKLVLPTIEATVDQEYLQYKKDIEESERMAVESKEAFKTFTPKSIEYKLDFNDEANKIALQFQYEPDAESFKKAVEFVSNPESPNPFANQDGTPNRQKVLEALYFGLNKEKVLLEAMKQAKNATIKAMLPDNSNNGIGNRQLPQTQEPNELHKAMMAAGVVN